MFVVAVDSTIDGYVAADGDAAGVTAVDLLLYSNLMDSDFERISFFHVAKRIHYEPLHNRKIQCQFQLKCSLLSLASNGIV